ncbi:MAG: squalene/phytoene synthase family protein [Planctomycetota bacterium]
MPTPTDDTPTGDTLARLLEVSSRTFALSIPLLPEPCRKRLTLAYLLFRVADTFEDETAWTAADRVAALDAMCVALKDGSAEGIARAVAGLDLSKINQSGYAELFDRLPVVIEAWSELDDRTRSTIAGHLCRTIDGMAGWIRGGRPIETIDDVRRYCYHVAGIVGELCTELFIDQSPALEATRTELAELSPAFGEALQLVNILRDEADDADEGRRYIPSAAARTKLEAIAGEAIGKAADYVRLLEAGGAAPGIVAFNALNLALARETLALVIKLGPGVKLGRDRVSELHAEIVRRTKAGQSVLDLLR